MPKHAVNRGVRLKDPKALIQLARTHTEEALNTIIILMQSEGSPPAVRMRCAEILIERGYGKAPQAILIQDERPEVDGRVPLMDRVAALRAATLVEGVVIELEASQLKLVSEEPVPGAPISDLV